LIVVVVVIHSSVLASSVLTHSWLGNPHPHL
jgi:hypothetical protein